MTGIPQFSDVPPAIEQVLVPDTCLGCACEACYVTLVGILYHTIGLVVSHLWAYDITPLADDITHVTRRSSIPLMHTAV
jgi:hypothetical protein